MLVKLVHQTLSCSQAQIDKRSGATITKSVEYIRCDYSLEHFIMKSNVTSRKVSLVIFAFLIAVSIIEYSNDTKYVMNHVINHWKNDHNYQTSNEFSAMLK